MISGMPSSSRSCTDGPAQSQFVAPKFDDVVHSTSQPVGLSVNATSPPPVRAAMISGVLSSPPMSAIATDADAMTVGAAIVACCMHVRPSMTRITPKKLGSVPSHDCAPPSVKLYDVNTIDGVVSSPVKYSGATIGVASTLTWFGNGSPAGGPTHSHCTPGKNTPGTGSRLQPGSFAPPGPTPHGKHSPRDVSQ